MAIIKRTWHATDMIQGPVSPFKAERQATLSPGDVAFLCDLISQHIEAHGDPESDLAPIRAKLKGEEGGC